MIEEETIIIIDDDPDIRSALSMLMQASGFATRCHASGEELLEAGPPDGPACLLLDLHMPGMDGLQVQEQLQKFQWDLPIIFLTAHADVPKAVNALKRGASDFFEKPDFDRDELLQCVRLAITNHRDRLRQHAQQVKVENNLKRLSPRELEVARLAAAGHANKVIGLELGISERTVEVHRGRAMRKLQLRNQAELIRMEEEIQRYYRQSE